MTSTVNAGEPETTKPQNESPTRDGDKKDDSGGSYSHDKPKETTTEKNGGNTAMEGSSTDDENKSSDAKLGEKLPSTENKTASEATGYKQDSETKPTKQGETRRAGASTVNGTGGTSKTGSAAATPSSAPPAAVSAGSSAPSAAAAGPPPPPVLRGTLSYNLDLKRHVIRGMWNYENSNAFPAQRFELIRNLDKGEDPKVLPKDGEFHGSFSLAYYHTTSKGKQKERSKVIPESGVNIKFTKIHGKDGEYKVDGQGTNQFGVFNINGTAKPSPLAGDATYDIELRKRYVPSQVPVASSASAPVSNAGEKKNKKRKHEHVGGVNDDASMDDDKTNDVQEGEPLPPPSKSFPSNVVCLQGKIYREESDELGLEEVVHRISGMWSSGLDLIVADPQNVRGLCNRFEYEHKSTLPNDRFPVSGRYSGWFDLSNPDGTRTRITEKDVTLKFRKNSEGFHNVEGRGSNAFGKYSITGSLTNDNVITIFRHFQQRKAKKSKDSSSKSVTSAPGPLHSTGQSKAAVPPPEPKLKLDDVKLPDDADDTETLSPTPLPAHGTYSAISRGVMRLDKDGAVVCSGKWAMTREHYNNGQISAFSFRLEPHLAAEAAAAMEKKEKDDGDEDTKSFPIDSAMYKGSFQMKKGPSKTTKVIDQQIALKFRKNSSGSYNVYGKGTNNIGEFDLKGTLILSGNSSGHVELYRVYPPPPPPPPPQDGVAAPPAKVASKAPKLPTKENAASKESSAATSIPKPRPGLQRRESSRLVKLPSRLEDDDPQAQLARIMRECSQVLQFMHEKDIAHGAFFREPVDPMALGIPTYHQVIKQPMDLGTIQRKMDKGEIKTPEEFGRLVRLVFENAMTFNVDPGHAVHQAGRNLLILFNQKFRDLERVVDNIRRTYKPSEAELKRIQKEEAKSKKRKAREEKKNRSAKRMRLDEAQAMAAANASSMAAVVAAAPSNSAPGGSITRAEFNMLLQLIQQLQGQVVQTHTLLANLSSSQEPDDNVSVAASQMSEADSVFIPPPEVIRPSSGKGKKKKAEPVYKPAPVEENKPLTVKEQEALTENITLLPEDKLEGAIKIIREATNLGDEDEIDLEIEVLDIATQRKLQRYVLQYVKPPKRPKAKKAKGGSKGKARKPSPKPQTAPNSTKSSQSASQAKGGSDAFFAFGSKGDSDSDSDDELPSGSKQGNGAPAAQEQFNLGGNLHDDMDEDEDLANGGLAAGWDISKSSAAAKKTADDDGLWGAAREEAAAAKAREEERKQREEKVLAEAESAQKQRLADAAARGDEIRAQRMEEEEKEARLREQQEKEAEDARKAARDAARAQVQSVEQTVDLDAQRDIMKQYEQSFLDKENGGGASPSSDFGF
jgi:hypothetical protein